jgi:hypothetical protein
VVSFGFEANTDSTSPKANITLLGQPIAITQTVFTPYQRNRLGNTPVSRLQPAGDKPAPTEISGYASSANRAGHSISGPVICCPICSAYG